MKNLTLYIMILGFITAVPSPAKAKSLLDFKLENKTDQAAAEEAMPASEPPDESASDQEPPSDSETDQNYVSYRLLSGEAGLELDRYWLDYLSLKSDTNFVSFVHERYLFYQHLGVGLIPSGLMVDVLGIILVMSGLGEKIGCICLFGCEPSSDCSEAKADAMYYSGYALLGIGTAAWIVGAIILADYNKRLKKLEAYLEQDSGRRAELQLVGAGPILGSDGRTPGLALSFVF